MATSPQQPTKRFPLAILCVLVLGSFVSAGCTSMKVPTFTTPGLFKTPDSASPYVPVGDGVVMAGSATADLYQKIRQAKLENAVVLEVLGDDQPIRVLPLPPGGRSVFVSALLKQTGVLEKLGSID